MEMLNGRTDEQWQVGESFSEGDWKFLQKREKSDSCFVVSSRRLPGDTSKRDTVIAVAVGLAVIGLFIGALMYCFERAGTRGVHGVIIDKSFVVQPETEITVGAGGLKKKDIPGEYSFKVRDTIKGTVYTLSVSKEVFERYSVGDEYYFSNSG